MLRSSYGLFPLLHTNLYTLLFPPPSPHSACCANLALFNIITRIQNVGLHNSWSSSVRSFLCSPDTCCPSAQNSLTSTFNLQSAVLTTNTHTHTVRDKSHVSLSKLLHVSTPRFYPQGAANTKEHKHQDISLGRAVSSVRTLTLKLYIMKTKLQRRGG